MRLVHIYHRFATARGGVEDVLAILVDGQAKRAIAEITVLTANTTHKTIETSQDGIRIIYAGMLFNAFMPYCPGWVRFLHRLKPDIIHLHLPCPFGEWAVWLAQGQARLVVSLHNDYVRPAMLVHLHRPLHRTILKRADAILVATPDYAATSPALIDLQPKVHIIPYGIDLASYRSQDLFPPRDNTILSAGRLCYYKGIEVLIEAAKHFPYPVNIIGTGNWEKRLYAQTMRQGLAPRIQFLGSVSEAELIAAMQKSALFVFPSTYRSEAFGLVQLKAMACGLPVVSSDLPGVSWLNRAGETGLTVPIRDATALAAAIINLMENPTRRLEMADGAFRRAQHCSSDAMVQAIQAVYESLI